MLLEHEGNYGLGMDAMETVCSWNTKDVMDRMLLQHAGHYGLCMNATVTVCSRNTKDVMDRMLLQHEGDYGLGMDVKVTVCSWNTKATMVWAWMQWKPYALGTRRMLWTVCSCSTKVHGCNHRFAIAQKDSRTWHSPWPTQAGCSHRVESTNV